jgi:hypothetical protein
MKHDIPVLALMAVVLPGGGSPKGLMDYYIDTAYPIERADAERIRIATYGDGSTL